MTIKRLLTLGPIVACALIAAPALGQDLDTVDSRADEALSGPLARLPIEEAILTGREDIVLLEERKYFTAFASTAVNFTTNPGRSKGGDDFDTFFSYNLGLRAATKIAEAYDVYVEANTFGAEYADNEALNYKGFGLAAGGSRTIEEYTIGGYYRPQFVWDDDFGDHLVTLHRISAYASRLVLLDENLVTAPTLTGSAIPSDPSDFTRYELEIASPVIYRLASDWRLTARPTAYLRHYPDFFEEVTNESRLDIGAGASLAATWEPETWLSLTASASVEYNHSTVDSLTYTAVTAAPQAVLKIKF